MGLFYVFNKNLSRFEKHFTMALTVNFVASTNITTPTILTLADTSTGTDGAITSRRVLLQKADGTYLVPTGTTTNYIVWDIASSSINLSVLSADYALNIYVYWMAGSQVNYYLNILYEFNTNARVLRIQLLKALAANPNQVNSANYFSVLSRLSTYIDGANEAVLLAGDITLAQLCNNNAAVYVNNPKLAY